MIDIFEAICSNCKTLRSVAFVGKDGLTVVCSTCANNLMNKIINYEIRKEVESKNRRY